MVESPKEAASNCKTKSSLLDEEIGKDFFSTWKSVSGAEDDAMDFTSPSLSKGSKGKKSNFNFDKLSDFSRDMDFALDGDFGNIPSSFNISMPDLDFSSPPRRPGKSNETNGKELESGKFDTKQDRFNFSFDFNELDRIDLDSSPKIEEKKSDKTAESASDHGLDPVREHEKNQSSRGHKAAGGSENHDSLSDKNPSTSADIGKLKGLESFDLDSSWNEGETKSDRNAETGKEKKSGSLHEQTQYSRSNLGGGGINANQKNQSSRCNMAAGGSKNDDSLGDGNPSTSTDIGKSKVVESFDLDSSWTEGENKTGASAETGKEKKSELHEQAQYSRTNLGGGSDAFEGTESDKFLTPKRVTTSMAVRSRGSSVKDDSRINCSPSRSANVNNINVPHGATSLEKEGNICTKVTNQLGQEMEGTVPTEQRYQRSTQDLCISSVSGSDSIQEAVPELKAEHSPDAQVKSTNGGEQDMGVKMVAGLESNLVDTSNLECSSPLDVRKQQKTNISVARKLDTQNTGSTGDSDTVASAQSDIVKDAAVASVSQDTLLSKHHMKEDRRVSKHLLPPLHSDPKVHKPAQVKEKGVGHIRLKPLSKSDGTGDQANTAVAPGKSCFPNSKSTETPSSSPVHERRLHIGNENTKVVNQRARASCSSDTRRKALPIAPESVKNDIQHNISGSQDHPSSLLQQKSKSSSLKCVNPRLPVSSIAPIIRSNKSIASTKNDQSPSNVLKKTPYNPCLNVPRPMTSKNDLPHSRVPREIKSLSPRVGHPGVSINATSEIVHSLGLQKYGLSSPSLKRKNIEGSDADPAASYPFKRFAESPNDSRKPAEASERFEKSLTLQSSSYQSTSTVEFTLDSRLSAFGVPLTMENDGIAEKAEAYTKELEDICNMLKKKHEEAKEILVRAIVNNNNLLMLNHPVYDEKIRAVQRFAARVLQRDLQV